MSSEKDFNVDGIACTLVGTVVTGFEDVALGECKERLSVLRSYTDKGKVIITLPPNQVSTALNTLRGIDHLYIVGCKVDCPELLNSGKENCEPIIKKFVEGVNWQHMIGVWNVLKKFSDGVDDIVCTSPDKSGKNIVKFRVTCNRAGTKHSFTSMDAAAWFGGEINDVYGWKVDLTKFDLEIILWINDSKVYVMASLNESSLHKRNISYFGPTTLRPTICHNMIRFGNVMPGEVVCDPMCGGGSIPIESALSFPSTFNIGGDNHELAYARTWKNIDSLKSALPNIDSLAWDVRRLPFKDNSVDLVVTDLPFGKRSGSKFDNRKLYPAALREMARICHQEKGRAVLLTQDERSLNMALKHVQSLWHLKASKNINIGGLRGKVYLIVRLLKRK